MPDSISTQPPRQNQHNPVTNETMEHMNGHVTSNGVLKTASTNGVDEVGLREDELMVPPGGDKKSLTESDEKEQPGFFKSMTRPQVLTLMAILLGQMTESLYYSLLAPFFPTEAPKKGASSVAVGIIFGSYQLVVIVLCPIYGRYLTQIGSKFMFVAGIVIASTGAIFFGLMEYCANGTTYIVMCTVVRMYAAVGSAGLITSSLAIAAHTFPGRLSTIMGLMQGMNCAGLMLGPPIGGALFAVGGFKLPFLVTGSVFLLCGIASVWVVPSQTDEVQVKSTTSRWVLLKVPAIWIVGVCVFAAAAVMGFIDVGLSVHLEQFHLNPAIVGLVYLIPTALVVFLAPAYGAIVDRFRVLGRPIIIAGGVIGYFGLAMTGPSPLLPLPRHQFWLVCTSVAVAGIGWASIVLLYAEFVNAAREQGYADNMATKGLISGVYKTFHGFGALLGPTVGGVLMTKLKFPWASTVMVGIAEVTAVLFIVFSLVDRFRRKKARAVQLQKSDEQKSMLDIDTGKMCDVTNV